MEETPHDHPRSPASGPVPPQGHAGRRRRACHPRSRPRPGRSRPRRLAGAAGQPGRRLPARRADRPRRPRAAERAPGRARPAGGDRQPRRRRRQHRGRAGAARPAGRLHPHRRQCRHLRAEPAHHAGHELRPARTPPDRADAAVAAAAHGPQRHPRPHLPRMARLDAQPSSRAGSMSAPPAPAASGTPRRRSCGRASAATRSST